MNKYILTQNNIQVGGESISKTILKRRGNKLKLESLGSIVIIKLNKGENGKVVSRLMKDNGWLDL